MKFFVTGLSGFAGRHLAAHLLESGHEVSGIARTAGASAVPGARVHACDVRDADRLRSVLAEEKPDGVFHLAGIAFAPHANRDPAAAYGINFLGAVGLLDAVLAAAPSARVVFPSSGEVYGQIEPAELPITENQPLRPVSPYGVGKAAADLTAYEHFFRNDLDVVRARPFNHTGPGQSPEFVCSEFARAVAAAECGAGPALLRTGDLDVDRDFADVRDIVRGYLALFERGIGGEVYNLASGRSIAVREVLDRLCAQGTVPLRVETDFAKVRRKETRRIEVSVEKVRAQTGWRATIPLERTLADLLDHWRRLLHP